MPRPLRRSAYEAMSPVRSTSRNVPASSTSIRTRLSRCDATIDRAPSSSASAVKRGEAGGAEAHRMPALPAMERRRDRGPVSDRGRHASDRRRLDPRHVAQRDDPAGGVPARENAAREARAHAAIGARAADDARARRAQRGRERGVVRAHDRDDAGQHREQIAARHRADAFARGGWSGNPGAPVPSAPPCRPKAASRATCRRRSARLAPRRAESRRDRRRIRGRLPGRRDQPSRGSAADSMPHPMPKPPGPTSRAAFVSTRSFSREPRDTTARGRHQTNCAAA